MHWPPLPYADWRPTRDALHLWTQVVGKVRLAVAPWQNHGWHVPLTITSRGLGSGTIFADEHAWTIEFDFLAEQLRVRHSDGFDEALPLAAGSVAGFHRTLLDALARGGLDVRLHAMPCEIPDAIPFTDDTAVRPFDAEAARRFWWALIDSARVFERYRARFQGKASPIHFFWGSFDLAHSRFSGRAAPPHPGGVPHLPDWVAREAYAHEVISVGFWPGDDRFPHAAYYAYAYPRPLDYGEQPLGVDGAFFHPELGEFLLPYDVVRLSLDPDGTLLRFAERAYARGAEGLRWDRASLDRDPARLATLYGGVPAAG